MMNSLPDQPISPYSELESDSNTIEDQLQNLAQVANEFLLKKPDSNGYSILITITNYLRLLQVDRQPREIFEEAYNMLVQTIKSGQQIENIPGWFRTNCFKIIRKSSNAKQVNHSAVSRSERNRSKKYYSGSKSDCKSIVTELSSKLQNLDANDREILVLRSKGLTYEQISKKLGFTVEFIRTREQKASRALRNKD
jgi:hypothetical protein